MSAHLRLMTDAGLEAKRIGAGFHDLIGVAAEYMLLHKAIDENFTKYTPNAGIADLKRAICDRYRADYGVEFTDPEVIVSAGGKQALYNAALALFGPGDEVITHSPYWPTLTEQIKLADATPVLARTSAEDGFAIRADAILAAVTPRYCASSNSDSPLRSECAKWRPGCSRPATSVVALRNPTDGRTIA